MCTMKEFSSHVIGLMPQEERCDLLHCRDWIALGNHTNIENPIIDIGIRRHLDITRVTAGIPYDHLLGFTLPDHIRITTAFPRCSYLNRECSVLGPLFGYGESNGRTANLVLERLVDMAHNSGIDAQASH